MSISPKHSRLIDYALKYAHKSVGKNIHVSLLVIRNKTIAYGVNSYNRTHTDNGRFGYRFNFIHSELDCIRRTIQTGQINFKRYTLYNFRFGRVRADLLMSKPCMYCMNLCHTFGIRKIYYSTPNGLVYEGNN